MKIGLEPMREPSEDGSEKFSRYLPFAASRRGVCAGVMVQDTKIAQMIQASGTIPTDPV